jgi:hypothetical protein
MRSAPKPGSMRQAVADYRDRRSHAPQVPLDAFQISSALLLLALVVHPPDGAHWIARATFALGLIVPIISRRFATFWVVAFVLFLTAPVERAWLSLDNHEILQVYWLGAFVVCRFATCPHDVLRTSARWMLALVFVFATAWKIASPDFHDGSAIEFFFGAEPRMADVAVAFDLQDEGAVERNWEQLATWRDGERGPREFDLEVGEPIRRAATPLALLALVLEAAVAVAYLLPLRHSWRATRDLTLVGFILLTYPLAPVLPFAWLLLSMGAMASDLPERRRNGLYIATFLVVSLVYAARSVTLFPLAEWLF